MAAQQKDHQDERYASCIPYKDLQNMPEPVSVYVNLEQSGKLLGSSPGFTLMLERYGYWWDFCFPVLRTVTCVFWVTLWTMWGDVPKHCLA